ncbi:hypothetical protein HBA12_03490 [Tenacibaculum mesophilum]|uniref:hypothetical protein n=1 Tax=Tenacibaculum mesophilum TaxID=104268 RepID=UPI001431E8B5|nr:hypothetical protein [Tenacibaculum mesophilum]KAF9659323.1 hypothetical protein HBA12_03490 [Tenacibaculum mesophilum]
MKRIYIQFLLLLTVVFSISLQAQTLPTVNNDEFLMNSGGTYSDLQPALAGRCSGCEVPDLNFNWSNSFDAAVMNETYIRRAADKKLREWYERQKVVIENFLENKYHKQFPSFNEAKDYAFSEFEVKNKTINVDPIVSTKNSDRIRRALKKKVHIKGLKALKIREAEIRAGNTNKPLYPDFEVNGTPLKDLKSTAAVTAAYNNLLNQFVDNTWKEFEGRHIIKILGVPFNNKVLKTKNNYYGSLGTWDKLDFMQFTIHYESIINRPAPIPLSEREIKLFNKYLDKANTVTATYVENYINANKESEMSLFHPNYWKIIWKRDYSGNHFRINEAKNKHQQLKGRELGRLIGSTSMNATSTIDYLVSLLKITDKDQLQWLNDHPSKGDEFVKELNEAKRKDADMPPPIPGELSFPPDHHQQLAQWNIRKELRNGAVIGGLVRELGLTDTNQKKWLYEHKTEADKLIKFTDKNKVNDKITDKAKTFATEAIETLRVGIIGEVSATELTLSVINNNLLSTFDTNYFNKINQFTGADLSDPYLQALWVAHFSAQCAILKFENPDWSDYKIYWEASKEMIHIALDLGGMVPVIGEVCDLTNGIIYTIEGDGLNATLSFAATIPVAGWAATGSKYAIKVVDISSKTRLTWKVLANGSIYFGSSGSKLRKVLKITNAAKHAHHLIPWAMRNHDLVQKAAKSKHAFHLNEALNGIPRLSNLHLTGHSTYNTKIFNILEAYKGDINSADEAYDFVSGLANHIRTLINNNPTLNSGQIADLIRYP